jgi:hypothetical protein
MTLVNLLYEVAVKRVTLEFRAWGGGNNTLGDAWVSTDLHSDGNLLLCAPCAPEISQCNFTQPVQVS